MTKRLGLFLLLTLLLSMTMGCGLSGIGGKTQPEDEAPSGEEAAAPTSEAPSGEAPSGEEAAEAPGGEADVEEEEDMSLSSLTGGLQGLDSYRSHFSMAFEGTSDGEAESWVYEVDMETVRDPFAQRIRIQGEAAGDGLESVQVGDMQYVVLGDGQCISSSAAEDDATDMEVFEPDDVVGGLDNARRVRPDERVNGVLCQHYEFDESNVSWGAFTRATGEMWVAAEGGYVVKYTLEADGQDPLTGGDEGHLEWVYEVRDVNQPITIEAPAGCDVEQSDFPVMADAADMTMMGGMVMYTSGSSFEDVLAFYKEQMPAEGWSDTGDSFVSSDTAMLGYTKEGRTANITLTTEDGVVSVLIMSE